MAIKFKHGGREWQADTAAEAIALRRQLEVEDQEALEHGESPDWIVEPKWTPDAVQRLIEEVGPSQKAFIFLLCVARAITSRAVMSKLHFGTETVLAGVVSGLSKQLQRVGFKPEDLYSVSVSWTGKDKTRTFRISPNFHWVATSDMGWPESLRPDDREIFEKLKL